MWFGLKRLCMKTKKDILTAHWGKSQERGGDRHMEREGTGRNERWGIRRKRRAGKAREGREGEMY